MLDLAEETLDYQDLSGALQIANKIPEMTGLGEEVEDFRTLAQIRAKTWGGQTTDLETAIREALAFEADRPLYGKAQKYVNQWQREIEDIKHLDRARQFAQGGRIPDLMTAIAEVSLIPDSHPRAQEAQTLMADWRYEIEVMEDRPYLNRAKQLAQTGTAAAYQAAIAEINQIQRGRALYSEAQSHLGEWQYQLERLQDQPYLDKALALASQGNFPDAIVAAQKISPGRSLYQEAQAKIDAWQLQIQAETSLRQAEGLSVYEDDPDSLTAAIRAADRVPIDTPQRDQADAEIEQWSELLLQIALERASYDLQGAIDVAKRVPPGSTAYWDAQSYVQNWQQLLE
jgi:soluble cytochrome b562